MKRLVLLGPPGVGKGTQAEKLSERVGSPKISTGDIFREAMAAKTPMGLKAKSFIDQGRLVPDEVVIGVVEERLGREDAQKGFILDGFPRTVPQAEALERFLNHEGYALDAVVEFTAPKEEIIARISGRLNCESCQRVYHERNNPPPGQSAEGKPICACGAPLIQRADDRSETVRERLRVYQDQTAPLVTFYQAKELLMPIDAARSIEEVTQEVMQRLSLGKPNDRLKVKRGN